jgi:proteasome lid subunit RPN8/RPN11
MGIQPAWMSSYTATSASYPSCPGRSAVGIYHNHPNGDCRFSHTDEREMDRLRHSVWLMSCGEGRFTWRLRASEGAVNIRRGSGS